MKFAMSDKKIPQYLMMDRSSIMMQGLGAVVCTGPIAVFISVNRLRRGLSGVFFSIDTDAARKVGSPST